jgi:hypothetical protein
MMLQAAKLINQAAKLHGFDHMPTILEKRGVVCNLMRGPHEMRVVLADLDVITSAWRISIDHSAKGWRYRLDALSYGDSGLEKWATVRGYGVDDFIQNLAFDMLAIVRGRAVTRLEILK